MLKPIPDKAEVSIDFPDKFYMGSFGRGSGFDLAADAEGVHMHLERREPEGEKRRVGLHVHYHLLARLLSALAESLAQEPADGGTRALLRESVAELSEALSPR